MNYTDALEILEKEQKKQGHKILKIDFTVGMFIFRDDETKKYGENAAKVIKWDPFSIGIVFLSENI